MGRMADKKPRLGSSMFLAFLLTGLVPVSPFLITGPTHFFFVSVVGPGSFKRLRSFMYHEAQMRARLALTIGPEQSGERGGSTLELDRFIDRRVSERERANREHDLWARIGGAALQRAQAA